MGDETVEVVAEVVGVEEEEHPATGLVADAGELLRPGGLGGQQRRAAVGRADHDPALIDAQPRVFVDGEPEAAAEEVDRLVVVAHDERHLGDDVRWTGVAHSRASSSANLASTTSGLTVPFVSFITEPLILCAAATLPFL